MSFITFMGLWLYIIVYSNTADECCSKYSYSICIWLNSTVHYKVFSQKQKKHIQYTPSMDFALSVCITEYNKKFHI